ncbi:MAG: hypothetical protein P4N60_03315 [Verrucomicrobiae bacterium]|nr:hypothetical protein [Verrucomicrobiae bacterium]
MRRLFRQLSAVLLIAALAGTVCLLWFDVANHLRLTFLHQRTGALAFILVGASYICLLLSDGHRWRSHIKGLLLGTGFLLWGGEQFMEPGAVATVMDSLVVLIFVSDLGWIIASDIRRKRG